MEPYQQRVIEERKALDIKLQALLTFLASDLAKKVETDEYIRMVKQAELMTGYQQILCTRIDNF